MEKTLIRVTLKSFEEPAIEAALAKLIQLAQLQDSITTMLCNNTTTSTMLCNTFPKRQSKWSCTALPPSTRRFTVLRSPHIDKKSREQFLQKSVAATMCFPPTVARVAPLLLALLKNSQLAGVQLRVRVVSTTSLY